MTTRSYSDLSDSATTFDPEEQFDRDIDERMKGMSKEEAVADAVRDEYGSRLCSYAGQMKYCSRLNPVVSRPCACAAVASAAIAAADKWDAEEGKGVWLAGAPWAKDASEKLPAQSAISPGLDYAIQDELDHPPASIMEEGK
jgi:hypothetical protein